MTRLTLVLVVVALGAIGASSTAVAQPAAAQAEVLFREGRELLAAGKLAEACNVFVESQKLEPAVSTLLNIADCREHLGQIATAWGLFLEAERETRAATDAPTRRMHAVAQEHSKKLEVRFSKLTVSVPALSQIDGLEITRGRDPVAQALWNRALPVDGGAYTISAHAPGTNVWSTTVTVAAESDSKTVEIPDLRTLARDVVKPVPEPVTPPATTTPTTTTPPITATQPEPPEDIAPRSPHASKAVPIVLGVGALVLFGGAIGFEAWGSSTYNDAKAEMTDQARRDSLQSSADDKRYVAEGLAVVGVAAAGVAIWRLMRHGDEHAVTTAHHELVVSPMGIALTGAF